MARDIVVDGKTIIRGVDGYSDFNALHSNKCNEEVELLAFDILALDGDDLRPLPLIHAQGEPTAAPSSQARRHLPF